MNVRSAQSSFLSLLVGGLLFMTGCDKLKLEAEPSAGSASAASTSMPATATATATAIATAPNTAATPVSVPLPKASAAAPPKAAACDATCMYNGRCARLQTGTGPCCEPITKHVDGDPKEAAQCRELEKKSGGVGGGAVPH